MLVVDPKISTARLLADQLRQLGGVEIHPAASLDQGYAMAVSVEPQLIFVEHASAGLDGLALTRRIRRSDLACRTAPIIMCTAEATAEAIFGARDAGVHEFMRKPFTIKDLGRRLEAVTLKPRDWVEGVQYVGPDRRRFNAAEYEGPRKRRADKRSSPAARLAQAIRIVRAAAGALDSDPVQARRALAAQAAELRTVGALIQEPRLAAAAAALDDCMNIGLNGPLSRSVLLARIDALIGFQADDEHHDRGAA